MRRDCVDRTMSRTRDCPQRYRLLRPAVVAVVVVVVVVIVVVVVVVSVSVSVVVVVAVVVVVVIFATRSGPKHCFRFVLRDQPGPSGGMQKQYGQFQKDFSFYFQFQQQKQQ
ncbi:unnamed protein product [Polarella glacialis]|uniref:Uncharacterized protein n=1 Tax=Polarella glacialis TaxID=89957 RepID=A0A813L349_POLGL|nr:unnamed protein product [Polarella glacialis]CAE8718392.1 unnamed protein product [Polarella glacialis]